MKKLILALLVAIGLFAVTSASAQCTAQIMMNQPGIQSGYLIFSGGGVNATQYSEVFGEVKKNQDDWVALQNMILQNPCTGWLVVHQIAVSTFHYGDIYRFHIKMFDGVLYTSPTVSYRVRKYCGHDFNNMVPTTKGISPRMLNGEYLTIHKTGGAAVNLSEISVGDAPKIIQVNDDMVLERIDGIGDETTTPSIQDVGVTSSLTIVNITCPEPSMQFSYSVYDLSGKQVTFGSATGAASMNMIGCAPGVYVVIATDATTKESVSKKIILEY